MQDGRSGLWGYIDKAGAWVIEPMFEQAGNFSQGMALVRVIGSLPALVGQDGRFALEASQGSRSSPAAAAPMVMTSAGGRGCGTSTAPLRTETAW